MFDDFNLDDFDTREYELAPPQTKPREKEVVSKNVRKFMTVRGISVDSNGKWWFACSEVKAKTFRYISHEEMKLKYPMFLVEYYEKYLRVEPEKPQEPVAPEETA